MVWGRYTMGRGVDIPWVGGQNSMDGVVDIPWLGDQNTIGRGVGRGGHNAVCSGDEIPCVGGSIYHG